MVKLDLDLIEQRVKALFEASLTSGQDLIRQQAEREATAKVSMMEVYT